MPAHSTGWHPVPYHYVEAGAFLAWCGEDMTNLTYDPVLKNIPDSDKCGACWSRMDAPLPASAQPTRENA